MALAGRGARLGLIGAFPFPYPQGSQVFVAAQARALAAAGARPRLFTYGRGEGAPPRDLELAVAPRWASPSRMRSGPQRGKPLADLALLATWIRAARREPFDCLLAHNAEAALIGLAARPLVGVPVVYVAHTLLGHELSAYLPARLDGASDALGARIDRFIAARSDGVIALSQDAADALAGFTRQPPALIPPGLDPLPPPSAAERDAACARAGVRPGAFILYAGNLDAYQDLELLARAVGRMPAPVPAVVVASHDTAVAGAAFAERHSPLRGVHVRDPNETRALCHAAKLLVMTRRRPGGFPIKLLNYMEAARAIVAFVGIAPGLEDAESAALLERDAGCEALAARLADLYRDDTACARLGAGARAHLEAHLGWQTTARATLAYLSSVAPRVNAAH